MKTTTLKLKELLEKTQYQLIDNGESKSSNYWYLWDSGINGEFDFEKGVKEDDIQILKLRVSDHEAMTFRSMTNNEVLFDFYPKSGYELTLNLDSWIEGLDEKEIFNQLNDEFEFDFIETKIIEVNGSQVKISIFEQELFENICAIVLFKNLQK